MRSTLNALALAASTTLVRAATLSDVCTTSYVQAALPADGTFEAITINSASVTATATTNSSVSGSVMYPDAVIDYCNVTFTYSHTGLNDSVTLQYWLPSPSNFQNRYLSTGGGGYAINSGSQSLPGGIMYGAVAGATDGGFGGFNTNFDAVFLLANGTINWPSVFMFGYQAHHELSLIGKQFTKNFFGMNSTKLYAYYQGCSEGGREGLSQVQRFADEWDGAVIGAPAMRFAHQQTQHLWSNVVEQTLGYYPPPCELAKIINETINACDSLDGKTDGVVSRTDLCQLNFNINSTIGMSYYCAATAASTNPFHSTPALPVQNGTVSAEAVAVASKILDGMHDSQGRRVYLSYQPAATFDDATTQYNNTTGKWELSISGLGAEFPARLLELQDTSTFANLDNVTYDTLKDWILQGWQMYEDTLQTTWPDLTPFQEAGGKILHYHGESDNSIPTASSVRYHESVRSIMYPNLSFNESTKAMADWYQLYLVPGAAHCAANPLQPNGPFPQTNLQVLINWVENNSTPTTLNATVLQGANLGQNQQICAWPLRPMWTGNGTTMECQYDQASIDTWIYDFDAWKMPVY
ncbi:feruloyl esterase-like protein B precursor [Tricladium varicosporioides]|nr:feruloyl esterase-like protein B precursor [Hymenoscyphus varicosporioides]